VLIASIMGRLGGWRAPGQTPTPYRQQMGALVAIGPQSGAAKGADLQRSIGQERDLWVLPRHLNTGWPPWRLGPCEENWAGR